MRVAIPSFLAMSCVTPVYSLAIDTPSTINGQPMPDRWIRYDLTPVNTATTDVSLTSRTNVKVYYATGSNCDTTAEAATIQGAIKQHLSTTDGDTLCSTECLELSHSGTWSGFLLIGPTNGFDSTAYCGPSLSFGSCTSGKVNNL